MSLQGDQVALFLSGQDIPVKECNVIIHQPTIKQIVMFKETAFINATQLFINVKENAQTIRNANPAAEQFTDLQLLIGTLNQTDEIKEYVDSFFQLIFPQYTVEIRDTEICFYKDKQRVGMINNFNYESFCDIIEKVFGLPVDKKKYKPANSKAAELAEKFRKREQILANTKGKDDTLPSLFGTYISILSIGMQIDMNTLFNYTPFQLYDSFDRYWKKVNSDFYQRVSTMPMMDTSQMEEPDN